MDTTDWPTETELDVHPLEGEAYVIDPDRIDAALSAGAGARLIGTGRGARALTLFALEAGAGTDGGWNAGDSEAVLYVLAGRGTVQIGEKLFGVREGCGVYVRAGECFGLRPVGDEPLRVLATICPSIEHLEPVHQLAAYFDGSQPERVLDASLAERHPTGDRFYKLLVGPAVGCRDVTQFVGIIPKSKAPEHYHEYEEVICVLDGEGRMWTGADSVPVSPGSVIFLPRGQRHCLEATGDEGLSLVGSFYPASSPAVRYATP